MTKVKNTAPWIYIISDLNKEEIIGSFYEKELQKTNQKERKRKKINYTSNGKNITIHIIAGLIKKDLTIYKFRKKHWKWS